MKTEFKHIGGPWEIVDAIDAPGGIAIGVVTETQIKNAIPEDTIVDFVCLVTPVDKATESDIANAKLIAAAPDLLEASIAAVKYDEAIRACANDPEKMASFCTATGDDLDSLYHDWVNRSKEAIKKVTR